MNIHFYECTFIHNYKIRLLHCQGMPSLLNQKYQRVTFSPIQGRFSSHLRVLTDGNVPHIGYTRCSETIVATGVRHAPLSFTTFARSAKST